MKRTQKHVLAPQSRQYIYRRYVFMYQHSSPARIVFDDVAGGISQELKLFVRGLLIFFVCMIFMTVIQLAYPKDRVLPFNRLDIAGQIGFDTRDQFDQKIRRFNESSARIQFKDGSSQASYQDIGLYVDANELYNELTRYSVQERLIPFSMLYQGFVQTKANRTLDAKRYDAFVTKIITEHSSEPKNASVSIQGTKLELTPSEEGYSYQKQEITSQLLLNRVATDQSVTIAPRITAPAIDSRIVSPRVDAMQRNIDAQLRVYVAGQTLLFSSEEIASWVTISPRPNDRTVDIAFDAEKVRASMGRVARTIDTPGKADIITMLNGFEAGRNIGTAGQAVNVEDLVGKIANGGSWPADGNVDARVDPVPQKQITERRYSRDTAGVQSLLQYWAQTHRGAHSIDFRTLDGRLSGSINAYTQVPAGSVAQLYIAHLAYGRIAGHSLDPSETEYCISRMIRLSDTTCINQLSNAIGLSASDAMLSNQGFFNTTLTPGAQKTTANDSVDWIIKANGRTTTSYEHSEHLFSYLSQQVTRAGIPAGSNYAVANKAGTFSGGVYDVGLVSHPRAKYALAVFSKNGKLADVADLSRQLDELLNQ